MDWFVLVLIIATLAVLYLITRTGGKSQVKPNSSSLRISGSDLLLPADRYYVWMLIDAELSTNPLLDVCYPFPSFRTLSEGAIQIVDKYSYDIEAPIGSKRAAELKGEFVVVTPLIEEMLSLALGEGKDRGHINPNTPPRTNLRSTAVSVVRMSKDGENSVRMTLTVNEELHDFLLAFQQLPLTRSRPRRAASNVGYFSNQIIHQKVGVDIIQRYKRPLINWSITPEVPAEWYPAIQYSFDYWNKHLGAAGIPRLQLDLKPWTGSLADPSRNILCLAKSSGYIGVGTTCVDQRDGTHMWSRIAIDPLSIEEKVNLFPGSVENRISLLRYTIIHELGHTLGLRHNFIAQADGNSSYMAYFPAWYPNPKGELEFLKGKISGVYDKLAIEYGYRTIQGESLSAIPTVLQARIDSQKCLFHTDENIDNDRILSEVHRHATSTCIDGARDWLRAWELYQPRLFKLPANHLLDVRRTFFFLKSINEAVVNSMSYVSGYKTDWRREALVLDDRTDQVMGDAVESLIGSAWRLDSIKGQLTSVIIDEQGEFVMAERPYKGFYTVDRAPLVDLHLNAALRVAQALFTPERIKNMSDPGLLLVRFLTTPATLDKKSIIDRKASDLLQLNVLTGFFSTIEHYKERYAIPAQASFEAAIQMITTSLTEPQRSQVARNVTRAVAQLQDRGFGRSRGGCGN